MKSLVNGCAAAALLMGLAFQAHAEILVRDAPIHAVPADDDGAADATPGPDATPPTQVAQAQTEAPAPTPARAEPAAVQALAQAKAPPAPVLTPEENNFFAVLGQRVTDAASAYESYVRRAGAIDPAFSGAVSVQKAVKESAAYHPVQLEEGLIAYAALVALRDQDFVDGVRAIQNPAFADTLVAHPEQVMEVRGAPEAAADVAGVLGAQGALLIAEGKAISKAAYDIQAQSWSKSPEADPKGMLDGAKASAGQTRVATTPSKEKLLASLVTAPQAPAGAASAPTPDVERGLALAALAILGRTGDSAEARYEALLHDSSSEECLKMAKLNLNQCLAVAGPHYEDVYCAGRHAVSDTGKCIDTAAAGRGSADALAAVQQAQAQPAPTPAPVQTAAMGPEQAAAYGKPAPPTADEDKDDDVAQPAPTPAAPTVLAAAPAPASVAAPVPVQAPALAAAAPPPAPVQAPAPRQYAEAPQAELQYPQPTQRAEAMPDPRAQRPAAPAQAYAPPQQQPYGYAQNGYPQAAPQNSYPQQNGYAPQSSYPQNAYAQNDYAPPQAPPAQYGRTYAQPQYQQPQYQAQQPYQQQPQYAPQPYSQQPSYAPPQGYPQAQGYAPQQPYYPQGAQGYYGR
jgi:hypothetical protein